MYVEILVIMVVAIERHMNDAERSERHQVYFGGGNRRIIKQIGGKDEKHKEAYSR